MKTVSFEQVHITYVLKDGETPEEIEDRLLDALETTGYECASWKRVIEEFDD